MKKLKYPVKKKRTSRNDQNTYAFENTYKPSRIPKIIIYTVFAFVPLFLSYFILRSSYKINHFFSFPLDDPWIHLTFAKNLAHYFSFSYFKNEMVTAGSTSPLYTILLAIGFFITENEMMLSYALGALFFVLSSLVFYRLATFEFSRENILAMVCTGLFIIDKWMNFISVSGMETTMFIFILLLCSYFYKERKAVPFAVMLGLIMWTRPDGIVFIIALIIDYVLTKIYSKDNINLNLFSAEEMKKILIIFSFLTGLYFLMNFMLSGSILPNTYNAKLTYYSPEFRSREAFLRYEVWDYFKDGAYYVMMIGFIFSFLKLLFDLYKRNYNQNTAYILFILGLVFIYWLKLPYAHRFGRYLMPIIPFFILVATVGFRDLCRIIYKYSDNQIFSRSIFYILVGIAYFIGIKNYDESRDLYVNQCKYIYDRQVKAAQWLKDNTNEADVIATHDVGAIGYYSDRKIVDIAGLVTPELINKINDQDYVSYVSNYMNKNGVTYLAFLREWYRVANKDPVYSTASTLPPEIMEIYKYEPGKTRILSREANGLLMKAQSLMGRKDGQQILYLTNRILEIDPNCAYAYFYRAFAYYYLNDFANFEKNLVKSIELFPDYTDSHYYLGEYYKSNGNFSEAKKHFERYLEIEKKNETVSEYLRIIDDSLKTKQPQIDNQK